MNTPKRKHNSQQERDGPSKRSKSGSRPYTQGTSAGIVNATANRLSLATRTTLLGSRDFKEPFSVASSDAVDEFREYILDAVPEEINLEECSLLLHATAKLLNLQMRLQTERITELAAFVTNTAKREEVKENAEDGEETEDGKKKKGRKRLENPEDDEDTAKINPEALSSENNESSLQNPQNNPDGSDITTNAQVLVAPDGTTLEVTNSENMEVSAADIDSTGNGTLAIQENSGVITTEVSEVSSSVDAGDKTEATGTDTGAVTSTCDILESNPSDAAQSTLGPDGEVIPSSEIDVKENTLNQDGSPVNTSATIVPSDRTSPLKRQAKENAEGGPPKKRRINGILPPDLLPNEYIDYDSLSVTSDLDDSDEGAPILFPEVDLWNGQFDPSVDPDVPVKCSDDTSDALAEGIDTLSITLTSSAKENPADTPIPVQISTTENVGNVATEEVTNPSTTSTSDQAASSDIIIGPINGPTNLGNLELTALTPEDQQEIQSCINQLHYLPFTCELTKVELERSFDNTVERLERIFKKHNMVFNRQLLNAATVVCANMVSTFSSRPSCQGQPPYQEAMNNCREIFSQGTNGMDQSDTITDLINSEKTILERTKEKSFAESQATIQKRLEEMQRLIVPKYIQWPLIAENTPEFFHRVKQFEQKMKKVLADEEKKESFDVSKYEIEVLNATSQEEEAVDLEEGDDINICLSPCPEDQIPNGFRPPGMMSPMSNSQSSHDNIRKWVPLSTVFNHMKKFDRNECARHFYAVLALLSSQNLDMNYDRHYSQESAALVTKKLDHSQDSKYPRGFKIMTSRCPDADKEEIYVTALASKSCNESFRDLISNEMHRQELPDINNLGNAGKRNDRSVSNVSSVSNGEINTDSDEEFVQVNYTTTFSTNLFGRKRKRKN